MEQFLKQYTIHKLLNKKSLATKNIQSLFLKNKEYFKNKFNLTNENFSKLNFNVLTTIIIYYYLLQKNLYETCRILYTKRKKLFFFKHSLIIHLFLKLNNVFITLCNENHQKISTYTIGLSKIRTQKKKRSSFAIQKLLDRLRKYLYKNKIYNIKLIIKGNLQSYRLYYTQFLRFPIFNRCLILLNINTKHGGCKEKKRQRK